MNTTLTAATADAKGKASGPRQETARPTPKLRANPTVSNGRLQGELPQFLRDLIASPPQHGSGLHQWLFKVARQLHAHRDRAAIVDLLTVAAEGCGRHVPQREIIAAVDDAEKCAWQPTGQGTRPITPPAPKWPARDDKRIASLPDFTLADLWDASPIVCTRDSTDAEFFADNLFPGNPLLCVGKSMTEFRTAPREEHRGTLAGMQLIVPSPMSAIWGNKKNPKLDENPLSMHTLDNTGPRKYLVTEFDQGTPDEQARIMWHLREFAPLVMVLSSGSKSLHAWFNCQGASEEQQYRFMRYAVSLGADYATWTRSQFVRLPQGWRADKERCQEVYYFNHELAAEGQTA